MPRVTPTAWRGRSTSPSHGWEEHDLADRALSGHKHHEAVDSDSDATRGGHSLLECAYEVLVVGLGLLVTRRGEAALLLEAHALLVRVVELREGVGKLHSPCKALEALHEAGLRAMVLRKR